jgi:20S proteasome alpha/beta subunit
MTTIAYRWGIIAADTRAMVAGSITGSVVKVVKRDDGALAGAAGGAAYCGPFLRWFLDGEQGDPPEAKEGEHSYDRGLIFRCDPDGNIDIFEPPGKFTLQAEYYAAGSGMDMALGAMWAGKGPEDAVRAAIAHDPNSGGEITVLRSNTRVDA